MVITLIVTGTNNKRIINNNIDFQLHFILNKTIDNSNKKKNKEKNINNTHTNIRICNNPISKIKLKETLISK